MEPLSSVRTVEVDGIRCGEEPLFLMAGPCVIEERDLMLRTAERLIGVSDELNLPLIFKSSFQKDNRSAPENYRGPGLEEGLGLLEEIRETYGVPVISDIHHPDQAAPAGEVLDVIQIPAFLCMQTDLAEAAAATGRAINVKHGQFVAPDNMHQPVDKIEYAGNERILLTERGYMFGYNDLVVDPRSFHDLRQVGYPVVFDVTHAIRRYGVPSRDPAGGTREYLPVLGRAGVAAGVPRGPSRAVRGALRRRQPASAGRRGVLPETPSGDQPARQKPLAPIIVDDRPHPRQEGAL